MSGHRAGLWLLGGVAVIMGGTAASAVPPLLAAQDNATALATEAEHAVISAKVGDLASARDSIARSAELAAQATSYLAAPQVRALSPLPYVGPEIRAARAGVEAATELLEAADLLLAYESTQPAIADGTLNQELLDHLAASLPEAAERVDAATDALATAPTPRLGRIGAPLARLHGVTNALRQALPGAARLFEAMGSSTEDDPFEVLILFENGAELRATGGLVGFTGVLRLADSVLTVSDVMTVNALAVRDPAGQLARVPADRDFERRYGGLAANTSLWSNINLSPHFPSIGPVAAALYKEATGITPDLVVRSDLVAIGWLLEAFPPITVGDHSLDPATIATDFIIDSYLRFEETSEQNQYLAEVVRTVMATAVQTEPDGPALISATRRAIAERRLSFWSPDGAISLAMATAGADGSIPAGVPGNVFVTIQNFAANKIDLYTETSINLAATATGCLMAGTATIALTNAAAPEAAALPLNRYGTSGRWWVNVYLPTDARVLSMTVDGVKASGDLDEEQGRPVVAALITAEPDTKATLVVTWVEPRTSATLSLTPQPLINPTQVSITDPPGTNDDLTCEH